MTMSGRVACGSFQCGAAAAVTSSVRMSNSRKNSSGSCSRWTLEPPCLDCTGNFQSSTLDTGRRRNRFRSR